MKHSTHIIILTTSLMKLQLLYQEKKINFQTKNYNHLKNQDTHYQTNDSHHPQHTIHTHTHARARSIPNNQRRTICEPTPEPFNKRPQPFHPAANYTN